MVEGRGGRGGRGRVAAAAAAAAASASGGEAAAAAALEPKWAAVAEYCRRHGVERGPVQCRKRWSNLAGDYKKIKEWERAAAASREPSFWAMRNDARRERRLPGFFDREVYDILEGRGRAILAGRSAGNAAEEEEAVAAARVEEEKEAGPAEAVFDSGRPATEEALFSEDEEEEEEEAPAVAPPPPLPPVIAVPVSEKPEASRQQQSAQQGTSKDKQSEQSAERDAPAQQGGQKRPRPDEEAGEGTTDLQSKLIEILDRNSRMVAAQLEVQNQNCELDREQRKDQANSLVLVLGRLADALGRIADKL
ncbi:Trihelix transcription factor ASR3 [Dichanthelium oligosanthes]|uniref:Trihelix transcription factor ASR3 n=1 Tax=Dichanthelium oligosanthes TaxID=888268 RepID=A0A1E5W2Z8_9POAL|nr:Trihelix transcription factor ASR3 [Dichanthelium oligosanthes]